MTMNNQTWASAVPPAKIAGPRLAPDDGDAGDGNEDHMDDGEGQADAHSRRPERPHR